MRLIWPLGFGDVPLTSMPETAACSSLAMAHSQAEKFWGNREGWKAGMSPSAKPWQGNESKGKLWPPDAKSNSQVPSGKPAEIWKREDDAWKTTSLDQDERFPPPHAHPPPPHPNPPPHAHPNPPPQKGQYGQNVGPMEQMGQKVSVSSPAHFQTPDSSGSGASSNPPLLGAPPPPAEEKATAWSGAESRGGDHPSDMPFPLVAGVFGDVDERQSGKNPADVHREIPPLLAPKSAMTTPQDMDERRGLHRHPLLPDFPESLLQLGGELKDADYRSRGKKPVPFQPQSRGLMDTVRGSSDAIQHSRDFSNPRKNPNANPKLQNAHAHRGTVFRHDAEESYERGRGGRRGGHEFRGRGGHRGAPRGGFRGAQRGHHRGGWRGGY